MKKWILLIVFMLACPVWAGDFRGTTWGMTREEVKAVEKAERMEKLEPVDALIYAMPETNRTAIWYYFKDGRLVSGALIRRLKGERNSRRDYSKAKEMLIDQYGKPIKEKTAMKQGNLAYYAAWDAGDTGVGLIVPVDGFKGAMVIMYFDKNQ